MVPVRTTPQRFYPFGSEAHCTTTTTPTRASLCWHIAELLAESPPRPAATAGALSINQGTHQGGLTPAAILHNYRTVRLGGTATTRGPVARAVAALVRPGGCPLLYGDPPPSPRRVAVPVARHRRCAETRRHRLQRLRSRHGQLDTTSTDRPAARTPHPADVRYSSRRGAQRLVTPTGHCSRTHVFHASHPAAVPVTLPTPCGRRPRPHSGNVRQMARGGRDCQHPLQHRNTHPPAEGRRGGTQGPCAPPESRQVGHALKSMVHSP